MYLLNLLSEYGPTHIIECFKCETESSFALETRIQKWFTNYL